MPDKDADMSHLPISDPTSEVGIQDGAVVSNVVHPSEEMNVTTFGFVAGEELTEHQAARAAVVRSCPDGFVITVIDIATGKIVWRYGHPGVSGSAPGYLWNPHDAMILRDGTVISADIKLRDAA
jgi:hypothetical protein